MDVPAVGIYLRLSRDDQRQGESASIESQRACLTQYASGRGWRIAKEYVDDGYSGLTFDRPQFQTLLDDIDRGLIDTVLTKDLSRLGRDQIYTAYYYQLYFPQKRVRYIAVSEGLDTAGPGAAGALFPFLTAANDFYTADVSRKVRSALTARKREGRFIGSQPPFGYAKDPEQPGHLVPDRETAPIARQIFLRYLQLNSVAGVAKELTERGVPTPAQYRGGDTGQARFPGAWSDKAVRRILTNPTYAGHLTQNRRMKINYKLKKYRELPREEWIVIPNSHEPIVDQERFDRVQELLRLRSYRPFEGEGHLLTGLVFCAACGSPMTYVRESPTRTYMVCQGYRKGGRLRLCTAHCVREDRVIETLRATLKELARQVDAEQLETGWDGDGPAAACLQRLSQARRQLAQEKAVMSRIYGDRAAGLLLEEEFRELFAQARERRTALEAEIDALEEAVRRETSRSGLQADIRRLLSFEELDRHTAVALVERIVIHEDKLVEIRFRFQRPS